MMHVQAQLCINKRFLFKYFTYRSIHADSTLLYFIKMEIKKAAWAHPLSNADSFLAVYFVVLLAV